MLMIACAGLIGATAYRTYQNYSQPGKFDWENRGLSDFHNGTYFPSLAFRQVINPYSSEIMDRFEVASPSRACPPITYMIHQPFTWFSLHHSDVVFFTYNVGLLFALAAFCLFVFKGKIETGWFLLLGLILLVSRPGHITLFTGYYTLELVLATLVSLHFAKSRPWLSAMGMLVASSKPTYVLPLILLMLARKNFRAVVLGVAVCTVAGVLGVLWLAQDGSIGEVIEGIKSGQEAFHGEEDEFPINSWTRVDLLGMVAKFMDWIPGDEVYLAMMFVLLIPPCIVMWRVSENESTSSLTQPTSLLAILAMLLTIYHHSYDCLLVFLPWVGVTFFPQVMLPGISIRTKTALIWLLGFPIVNYLSTQSARSVLGLDQLSPIWQAITIINTICLTAAFGLLVLELHSQRSDSKVNVPN